MSTQEALQLARTLGFTDEDIAKALRVSARSVARWRTGETTPLAALEKALWDWAENKLKGK